MTQEDTFAKLKLMLSITILLVIITGINIISTDMNFLRSYAQSTDPESLQFVDPINLSNNIKDSVYAQVASYKNNVYVVWEENDPDSQKENSKSLYNNKTNYDILIRKSSDGGLTFGKEVNLSNNRGFSEHPQIAVSKDIVNVAWIDNSMTTNKDVLYRKSTDSGKTFGDILNLSNNSGADSDNLEIATAGNNVYAVWQDTAPQITDSQDVTNRDSNTLNIGVTLTKDNGRILLRASTDGGNSFKEPQILNNNSLKSYPKIAAFENDTYVAWNVGIISDNHNGNRIDNLEQGIFLTKSTDSGSSFSDPLKLNRNVNSIGESQIASFRDNVYVVWGGNPDDKVEGDLFFTRSTDDAASFSDPVTLKEGNTLNVEVATDRYNNVYVAWQSQISNDNDEILIIKSSDGGYTFHEEYQNLSENDGISECTSISVSQDNTVYLAWEDSTFGNHEILFTRTI